VLKLWVGRGKAWTYPLLAQELGISLSEVHGAVKGTERGLAFAPIYPAAPAAALRDSALHEMLALLDAVRGGRARERQRAIQLIEDRLK
jgi:hypothetical protein